MGLLGWIILIVCVFYKRKINNEKVLGQIYIPASSSDDIGLIRLKVPHENDDDEDIPIILYRYDGKYYNYNSHVVFDIYSKDGLTFAKKIERTTSNKANRTEDAFRSIMIDVPINLHNRYQNSDDGGAHKKRHIITNLTPLGESLPYYRGTYDYLDPNSKDTSEVVFYSVNVPQEYMDSIDTSYYFYFNDTFLLNGVIEDLYRLDVNHVH